MAELPVLLIIVVAFWFLLIRPQQRRARQAREMQDSVEVGAKILLTSGVYGEVAGVTPDYLLIAIADGVEIKVVRNAIGQVLSPETAFAAPAEGSANAIDNGVDEGIDENLATESPEASATDTPVDLDKPTGPETPEQTLARLRKQEENQ